VCPWGNGPEGGKKGGKAKVWSMWGGGGAVQHCWGVKTGVTNKSRPRFFNGGGGGKTKNTKTHPTPKGEPGKSGEQQRVEGKK